MMYTDVTKLRKLKVRRSEISCVNMIDRATGLNTTRKKCQDNHAFKEKLFLFQGLWEKIVMVSVHLKLRVNIPAINIECFHMTSRRSFWCSKIIKRRPNKPCGS